MTTLLVVKAGGGAYLFADKRLTDTETGEKRDDCSKIYPRLKDGSYFAAGGDAGGCDLMYQLLKHGKQAADLTRAERKTMKHVDGLLISPGPKIFEVYEDLSMVEMKDPPFQSGGVGGSYVKSALAALVGRNGKALDTMEWQELRKIVAECFRITADFNNSCGATFHFRKVT